MIHDERPADVAQPRDIRHSRPRPPLVLVDQDERAPSWPKAGLRSVVGVGKNSRLVVDRYAPALVAMGRTAKAIRNAESKPEGYYKTFGSRPLPKRMRDLVRFALQGFVSVAEFERLSGMAEAA